MTKMECWLGNVALISSTFSRCSRNGPNLTSTTTCVYSVCLQNYFHLVVNLQVPICCSVNFHMKQCFKIAGIIYESSFQRMTGLHFLVAFTEVWYVCVDLNVNNFGEVGNNSLLKMPYYYHPGFHLQHGVIWRNLQCVGGPKQWCVWGPRQWYVWQLACLVCCVGPSRKV